MIQLSLGRKLEHQVNILIVFEVVVESDDVGMVETVHNFDLVVHLLLQPVLFYLLFLHHLDGKYLVGFLVLDFVN